MKKLQPTCFSMLDLKAIEGKTGFFKVVNPLFVFKKVMTRAGCQSRIANLIIPIGATVFLGREDDGSCGRVRRSVSSNSEAKLRASEAYVHSIVDTYTGSPRKVGHGWWDNTFVYRVGETAKPRWPFSMTANVCESGIHFFLNVDRARRFG